MHTQEELNDWSRREFNLPYGAWCAGLALAIGWHVLGMPLSHEALEAFLEKEENRRAGHSLLQLERKGFARRGPKFGDSGLKSTWLPTDRLLRKFLPGLPESELRAIVREELAKDERSGPRASPGVVKCGEEIQLAEVG